MALTLSGTNGVVGAGFTLDPSGASVTAGVGTFSSVRGTHHGDGHNLTSINAANLVGVCTSGLTKTGGFGLLLQVVTATTTNEASTSSSSYVDTNVTASITPSSTSSKILVLIDAPFHVHRSNGTSNSFGIKILRDSTEITDAITDEGSHQIGLGSGSISSNRSVGIISKIILDSPSSTSSLTYKLQMGDAFSGNTVYFQDGSTSHITLMEVAG